MQKRSLCSWSGGKDSCFALMKAIQQDYVPKVLLNVLNEKGQISRSHGIPYSTLKAQATAMNLPIHMISSSWEDYEKKFTEALGKLAKEHSLTHALFGDIDLQEHRDWEEKVCSRSGLTAVLPLWKQDRNQLVLQMIEAGIETIIVSCNEKMGESFLGSRITAELVEQLELLGIDACGENGEYHTLVTNCPQFSQPVKATIVNKVQHNHYWFAQLE